MTEANRENRTLKRAEMPVIPLQSFLNLLKFRKFLNLRELLNLQNHLNL